MKLDRFYPVVDNAAWVRRVVLSGARLVQLRAKDMDDELLRAEIIDAKKTCAVRGAQLIVNDYWQLAIDEACDFIHLGQEDLAGADIKAIRNAGIKIGISTHSEEELETALAANPAYIALGPIYPTILKKMPWQPQGLEKITQWKRRVGDLPLVAIGGITLERAQGCFKAGADSVAAVTDITLNKNPDVRAAAWVESTRLAA